jgi:hypothetical protein
MPIDTFFDLSIDNFVDLPIGPFLKEEAMSAGTCKIRFTWIPCGHDDITKRETLMIFERSDILVQSLKLNILIVVRKLLKGKFRL